MSDVDQTIDGTHRVISSTPAEPIVRLTQNQEAFTLAYLRLGAANQAYRLCYNVKPETLQKTVNELASKVLRHPKVRARIEQLRRTAADYGVDAVLEYYNQNRNQAIDLGQIGAANGATTGIARVMGYIKGSADPDLAPMGTTINIILVEREQGLF